MGRESGDSKTSAYSNDSSGIPRNAQVDPRFARFAGFRQKTSRFATLAYGHAGKAKVLQYDLEQMVRLGAFRTALGSKGTIFTMDSQMAKSQLWYVLLFVIAFLPAYFIKGVDLETKTLEASAMYFNTFIPPILGLYVSLNLTRWWALRERGIGRVLDAAQNLALMSGQAFPGPEWDELHDQVVKYSLASISFLVNTCRGETEITKIGPKRDNLLTAEELIILETVPYRARPAIMWAWVAALMSKLMLEQAIPVQKFRDITLHCVIARDAISVVWTHLGTQLPFAYVHLVTLLVNINNIVVSVKSGMVFAVALHEENYSQAMNQLIYVLTVPLLYQGLLSISYVIHDPFGEDLLDFPVMAFQEYMNESSLSMIHYKHECPALCQTWGKPPDEATINRRRGFGTGSNKAKKEGRKSEARVNDAVKEELAKMKQLMHDRLQTKEMSIDLLRDKNRDLKRTLAAQSERLRTLEERVDRAAAAEVIDVYMQKVQSDPSLRQRDALRNAGNVLMPPPLKSRERSLDSSGAGCQISSC
eukprot:gnl/TRDRNA2_/TRDRNA2_175198_c1_seq5.p1 gnl/TRDRNA2_/TRDRNA2_175198_c1~~gnl/TRDRNA2_/TRDRNA2_175198_c1_seq5.p1  ORF type:complete len:532 (-),score=72.32 gnl/TRDRNA2_/TRDRNA2_175198_c1_seq5:193-1788(-)